MDDTRHFVHITEAPGLIIKCWIEQLCVWHPTCWSALRPGDVFCVYDLDAETAKEYDGERYFLCDRTETITDGTGPSLMQVFACSVRKPESGVGMTVAALIARLQKLPQDLEVYAASEAGYVVNSIDDLYIATPEDPRNPGGPARAAVILLGDG